MKCQSCQTENPEGAKFCRACGTKLEAQAATSAAESTLEPAPTPEPASTPEPTPVEPAASPAKAAAPVQDPAPAPTQSQPQAQAAAEQPAQAQAQVQDQVPPQGQVQAQGQPQSQQPPQASANVKAEISKLQGKLDNSNSSFLKGRSIWDVVGLIAVAVMIVAFFLPSMVATVPYAGTMSLSLSALMSLAGANSYTSSISFLLLIYLFPALCCIIDLVITKENSSRHVRLIILGFLNMLLQSSFSTLAELSSSIRELSSLIGSSADVGLGIGFYLSVLASIVIVVVGAIGIYEKKKGKISA